MKNYCLLIAILFIAQSSCSLKVWAGTDNLGSIGARNNALGGASQYTDPLSFGAYGNPATLANKNQVQFSMGLLYNKMKIDPIEPQRTTSTFQGQDTFKDNTSGENSRFGYFGLILPIYSFSKDFLLSFGLTAITPVSSLARIHALTEDESHYLLYNSRQMKPEIFSALALRTPMGLSIGAGLYYSLRANGEIQTTITDNDAKARLYMDLKPVYTPYVGVLQRAPIDKDNIVLAGAFYRGEQEAPTNITLDIDFDININSNLATIPFAATSHLVAYYDPTVLGIGLSYLQENYKMALHLAYIKRLWSGYKAPVMNLSGHDLSTLTGGNVRPASISLEDTHSFLVGIEKNELFKTRSFTLGPRLGFEYHTSALPDHPTSLTILDSERRVLSAGLGTNFIKLPLSTEVAIKWTKLKDKNLEVLESGTVTQRAKVGGDIFTVLGDITFEY